ncbi:MlaD family protein [Flavobacterium sp.]|uniref:MlaD family protein n=1 Tax=Flavobacterium sp. TaxID=239 RepID=UPI0037516BEA
MNKNSNHTWKLGMFVIIGITVFILTIYLIGKSQNLFGSTFALSTKFKNVSGLTIGNNVRFSGINVGTVDDIQFVSDTSVVVKLIIKDDVQKFIKVDATASIGSDGLMGDKVLTISPGRGSDKIIADNGSIRSTEAIEMEDLMKGVKVSVDNAGIITNQLAQFSSKMNNNNGALSKLMTDQNVASSLEKTLLNLESSSNEFSTFTKKMNNKKGILSKLVNDEKLGSSIDSTITNIQTGTIELNETVKAAQNNFLLKGYFNKKKKAEAKKLKDSLKQK